ncbi:MAG: hypothetical protein FWF56_05625 [Firmicutes bacterium]|nr:hypothetical protein [Bacillota bacterium]
MKKQISALKHKINEKLYEEKKKRIEEFVSILKQQKHPIEPSQYKKLIRLMPREMYVDDWLEQWIIESKKKREANEADLAALLSKVAKVVNRDIERESIKQKWHDAGLVVAQDDSTNTDKELRKPATSPQSSVSKKQNSLWVHALGVVLIAIVLTVGFVLNTIDFGNDKLFDLPNFIDPPIVNIVKYHEEDALIEFPIPQDVYDILQNDDALIFNLNNIFLGSSKKYSNKNNINHLFSYILSNMLVDASTKDSVVAFDIDYMVRYEQNFEFRIYKDYFEPMLYNKANFSIDGTHIFYSYYYDEFFNLNYVYLTLSYGDYDYFLTIREYNIQEVGVVSPLNDENIQILIRNLLSQK